jgi:tetratricopeptide (TPR) repeat protein
MQSDEIKGHDEQPRDFAAVSEPPVVPATPVAPAEESGDSATASTNDIAEMLAEGARLASDGHNHIALIAFNNVLEHDPDNAEAWHGKAQVLLGMRRLDSALACVDIALHEATRSDRTSHTGAGGAFWDTRGHILTQQQAYDEAIEAFARASELAPADANILLHQAQALHMARRADEALETVDMALALDPTATQAWHLRAQALRSLDRMAEADYADRQARGGVEITLAEQEQLEEALAMQVAALEESPDDIDLLLPKALSLYDLRRYEEALATFEQVLALESEQVVAWNGKSDSLAALGRHDDALVAYDHALALAAGTPNTWHNKGVLLTAMQNYDEALSAFDRALDLVPNLAVTWVARGTVYHLLHLYDQALDAYDRALAFGADELGTLAKRDITRAAQRLPAMSAPGAEVNGETG